MPPSSAPRRLVSLSYDSYLRGQTTLRNQKEPAHLEESIRYFEEALRKDGKFALAYSGIANANRELYRYKKEARYADRALSAAQQAVRMDESSAEAHFALAGVFNTTGRTPEAIADRVEIMKRCAAHETAPAAFAAEWADADAKILKRIARAKKALDAVAVPDALLEDMAQLCKAVGADGLRGELTLLRAARASAALDGAKAATRKHLKAVAPLALRHRLRRNILDETGSTVRIDRALAELFG